jgi:hypothetical protein
MNLFFLIALLSPFFAAKKEATQMRYCDLRGVVYVTQDVRKANYLVFEDESKAFADILVYEESNKLFTDKAGLWYFTDNIHEANFVIYYVETKQEADFSLYFIDSPTFAGCQM